jgi:hypothetical protein
MRDYGFGDIYLQAHEQSKLAADWSRRDAERTAQRQHSGVQAVKQLLRPTGALNPSSPSPVTSNALTAEAAAAVVSAAAAAASATHVPSGSSGQFGAPPSSGPTTPVALTLRRPLDLVVEDLDEPDAPASGVALVRSPVASPTKMRLSATSRLATPPARAATAHSPIASPSQANSHPINHVASLASPLKVPTHPINHVVSPARMSSSSVSSSASAALPTDATRVHTPVRRSLSSPMAPVGATPSDSTRARSSTDGLRVSGNMVVSPTSTQRPAWTTETASSQPDSPLDIPSTASRSTSHPTPASPSSSSPVNASRVVSASSPVQSPSAAPTIDPRPAPTPCDDDVSAAAATLRLREEEREATLRLAAIKRQLALAQLQQEHEAQQAQLMRQHVDQQRLEHDFELLQSALEDDRQHRSPVAAATSGSTTGGFLLLSLFESLCLVTQDNSDSSDRVSS